MPVAFAVVLRASGPEFQPNLGQAAARYSYVARAGSAQAYVDNSAIEFRVASRAAVRLSWVTAPDTARWFAADATGDVSYYCNHPDADLCRKPVRSYARLIENNLYPNVDWVLYGRENRFEYDLIVHPGAKLDQVRLRVDGAVAKLNPEDGSVRAGDILHWRPAAYQLINGKRTEVEASLIALGDSEFGFKIGPHRTDLDLIVDPVIQPIGVAGGSDEDTIVGTSTSQSCSFRYGVTRSADWSGLSGSGHSVFVQLTKPGLGTRNIFWGGNGDSQVGGADTDLNNCGLYLVGWTSAPDAPVFDSVVDGLSSRAYAGGATDGFMLEFGWAGLAFASYYGGPGADRIYDVRRTAPSGSRGPFALAGETDNSAWPLSTMRQVGPGGKTDAFAAIVDKTQINLLIMGGSGNDRAMRLRAADTGYWAIGGESDSSDFPTTDASRAAGGKDLWAGRIATDLSAVPLLRLFGGAGDEQFGGLAWIAGSGLYLAGTTNSTDLPARVNSFHGGATDGFVAALDASTAEPSSVSYIGGSGRDEIAAMTTNGSELLLAGDTDSTDIVLPGMNQTALGGLDGLFVISDTSGAPSRGIRFGGSADDRALSVESTGFGQATLAGSSDWREWIQTLDPYASGTGGQDGYAVSISFADVQITPAVKQGDLYVGKDLQSYVRVTAVSEPGMDGILVVRSSDPSRLLVSTDSSLPGTDQILLTNVETAPYGPSFVVQALADSGEVDVIVEGRSAPSPNGIYPRQVVRVQLAPAALFVLSKDITVAVGNSLTVNWFEAPVLPDGTAGPFELVRAGLLQSTVLTTSDPDAFSFSGEVREDSDGYSVSATAVKRGDYTLVPSSSLFPTAPGQSIAVHVVDKIPPSVFSGANYYIVKDTVAPLNLILSGSDSLVFTSDDPSRLLLGANAAASAASVTLTSGSLLFLAAQDGDGTVGVHVTGTYQGQQISEAAQVRIVPYTINFSAPPPKIGVGVVVYPNFTLTPQLPPDVAGWSYLQAIRTTAALAGLQLQSSNPAVLRPQVNGGFVAVQPGTATIGFPASAPQEFSPFSATVEVVQGKLDFGVSVIRIPVGGSVSIYPLTFPYASITVLKSVRLRVDPASNITILGFGSGSGTDVTVDFSTSYTATLSAPVSQAGQQTTLYISAPGIPEFSIPIHVVQPIFVADVSEYRLVAGNTQSNGAAVPYHIEGYEAGQVVDLAPRAQLQNKVTVYPVMNPTGICTAPASVDVVGYSLSIPVNCAAAGVTTLTLQPGPGAASAQTQFSARIVSQPAAPVPLSLASRVLVGNGLQSQLSMYSYSQSGSSGPYGGTLTSSDPDRVRLSLDPNAPGSGSVTIPSGGHSVFVQGYGSDGTATLSAQSSDGRTGQVTVYLFPATLAVRPAENNSYRDLSPVVAVNQPLSSPDFSVNVRPYLIDPGTNKLLWNSTLSIRGGSDPTFVRAQSSDATIVQPAPPDAILSEGDTSAVLQFHANATGDVRLSATQPTGFISVPDSSLQMHIFQGGLDFSAPVVLSADLETPVNVVSPDTGTVYGFTATSLDPRKLLVSLSQSTTGQASVVVPSNGRLYLQALSGVEPGDQIGVRLDAPGYVTSQAMVTIRPAELQMTSPTPFTMTPLTNATLGLSYGPVDSQGKMISFGGTLRPGVNLWLQAFSNDPTIVAVPQKTIALNTYTPVALRPLMPGNTRIFIEGPLQTTGRATFPLSRPVIPPNRPLPERLVVDVVVGKYQFPSLQLDHASRYLVSKFTVSNPRSQATTVTVTSNGIVPVRLGTDPSGTGAPAAPALTVTLNANEARSLYLEPTSQGNSCNLQLAATDFDAQTGVASVDDPLVNFMETGPLNIILSGGAVSVTAVLNASYPQRELPLGTSYGPLTIQVQSSNPNVLSVGSGSVTFSPGDSRKTIQLKPEATGAAVVSLIVPASFAGSSPTRRDIIVNVN